MYPNGGYIEGGVQYGFPFSTTIRSATPYIDRAKRDFGYVIGVGFTGMYIADFGLRFVINTSDFDRNNKGLSFWSFAFLFRYGRL
jgi:hypothetical protein